MVELDSAWLHCSLDLGSWPRVLPEEFRDGAVAQ